MLMSWVPKAIGTPDDGGREDEGQATVDQQRRKNLKDTSRRTAPCLRLLLFLL